MNAQREKLNNGYEPAKKIEIIKPDTSMIDKYQSQESIINKQSDEIEQLKLLINVIQNKLGMDISIEHKKGAPGVSSITFGPGNK